MSKEIAYRLVDEFEKGTSPGKFTKLDRWLIAAGLRVRIDDPFKIQQSSAGICGPATVVHSLALSEPHTYAGAVIGLFVSGVATIRKWQLKPDAELLGLPCPPGQKNKDGVVVVPMEHVDWIILASIRDSENWFVDYHSDKDNWSGGTQDSEIASWMNKAGFSDVQSDSGGILYTTRNDKERMIAKCLDLFKKKYHVVLAINASIMRSSIYDFPKLHGANHVVVLADKFDIPPDHDSPVNIPVFTWGRKTKIPEIGGLKYGQFLDHFESYIAGKL